MKDEIEGTAATESRDSILWCNFCGFKTTDLPEYLKHSCKEVLEKKGVETAPTDTMECRS
jgi:hypothetical protein